MDSTLDPTTLRWILIALVVISFAFDAWLDRLNLVHSALPVPERFADLYDAEKREKSLRYEQAKYTFSLVDNLLTTALKVAALTLGWAGVLDRFVRSYTDNDILITVGFFLCLGLLSSLISLPFSIYGTFSLEARFGFNTTTPATFVLDKIKGMLVSAVIMSVLLGTIAWLYSLLSTNFWFAGWIAITVFSLVMFAFGTTVIVPMFNKLTPLPEGPLREAIIDYCSSQGYEVGRLFVMDGSKRSTKANAFFAGMGRAKTIVLFDTLIEKLTVEEVVAVLAHEVGHYKRKHIFSMLYMSIGQTFIIMAMLGYALNYDAFSLALGGDMASFHLGAIGFFLLFSPLDMVVSLWSMSYSRRNEFDADEFSTSTYAAGQLRSGLAKISTDALANLNPHPLYVKVHYSHPPTMQRLAALDAANGLG